MNQLPVAASILPYLALTFESFKIRKYEQVFRFDIIKHLLSALSEGDRNEI